MSEITVVMASYNGEAYIEEQINSILSGTFQDFLIQIYDDGSTDRTREIVKEIAKEHPGRVELFCNAKNKGVVRNFIEGAKNSDAPYVMFSDQDDVWLPEKLSKSLAGIKKREKEVGEGMPVVFFTDVKVVNGELMEIAPSFHESSRLDARKTDLPHLLMENKMNGCTMIINRAVVEKLGSVPGKLRMHDWWIGLIGAAFGDVSYLPEATLLYRQHEGNVVGSQSFLNYVRDRLSSVQRQREALKKTEEQAEDFLEVFGEELSEEKREVVEAFAALRRESFIRKRYLLIKYGFWKTGLIRNIGVFLLI